MLITKHVIPREALHEPANVPLPRRAQVLSVCHDGGKPVLYAAGEGEPVEPRWFRLCWTRDTVPDGAQFVGTIRVGVEGGGIVWHCFELVHSRGHHGAGG